MPKQKKLSPDITIKVKVKVKREVYDKIKKWGDENEMADTIESNLEALVAGWFEHWDSMVDEMTKEKDPIQVPTIPLLFGPDGQPIATGGEHDENNP